MGLQEHIIYIPNSYDESVEHPPVNFHGFGGRAADFVYAAHEIQAERINL